MPQITLALTDTEARALDALEAANASRRAAADNPTATEPTTEEA